MSNEYLDMLKGAPTATGAAPEDNEYLDLLQSEAQRKKQVLAGNLAQAVTVNPEQYSAQRRVAGYLGYPTAVVQAMPQLVQQAKAQQVQADASTSPVLEKKYSDADFAALAHDDSFTLSKIGEAVKYLVSAPGAARGGLVADVGRAGRSIASGVPAASAGLYNAAASVFGVADQGIQLLDDLAAKITGTPTRQIVGTVGPEGFLRYLGGQTDDFAKAVQGADPNAGFVEQSVMSGFQSAGQNLATLPLGLSAAGEKAMLSAIGLITGGQSYGKARDAGLSPLRAAAYGAEDAVAEVLTEKYLGAAGFLDKVKAGASATKLAIYEITKEVPGELAATLWQNFNEWTNVNPEKSLAAFLREQPEALAQTVIATLVGGSTQIGAVKGIQKVAESVMGMRFENIEAQRSADALGKAMDLVGQSKLLARSPEELKAVLDEMADGAEVRFDARTLAETLQQSGLDAEAIKQKLPSIQDQIVAATESGGEVRVPVGEFLAGVKGTPLEQVLLQHARVGNNEMSQAEAKQAGEQAAQYLETEAQRVLAQAQDAKAMQESSDRVRQSVLDQLNALGRFRQAVNEGYATWAAAFYTTMAGRTGLTPEEFAAKYPLRIVGETGQGLNQSAPTTPEFQKWFGESKVVDAQGQPLMVYHGTNAHAYSPGESIEVFNTRPASGRGGAFFTDSPRLAKQYGERTYSTYLSLKNPLVVYADGKGWTTLSGKSRVGGSVTDKVRSESNREAQKLTDVFAELADLFDEPAGEPVSATPKVGKEAQTLDGRTLGDLPGLDGESLETDTVVKAARRLGYDGVIFKNVQDSPTADASYERVLSDVFAVFNPEQIKSATGNRGTYDPNDPSILNQQARGSFHPANLELALSPTADLSTFFHETGHFFLEVMADIASQPDAPAGVQEDIGKLLKWFGVPDLATWQGMTLEQQRPYHERFAESVEQYLIEGKAPSVELAPVFRRFRAWVLSVYRSLQQFVTGNTEGPQLSDEVRQVLDRMLASQDQIEQAEEVAGMLPDENATGEALDKLTARSIRDLKWAVNARSKKLKELQAQAADTRKAVREEVTTEVDATAEMQARAALDKLKINPDFTAASAQWKEQRAAAEAQVREELRAALYAANPDAQGLAKGQLLAKNKRAIENQVQARMIEWDRENPKPVNAQTATDTDLAVVADSYGFPDAQTMLQAIDAFGKREDVIEGLTDQRMLEQHGDLVDPRAIAEAANEAVHNEARAKALATELKAQAELLGQRTDTGQLNAAGARVTVNALAEAARQFGARVVGRTPLRDLRATAWQHTSAERRAARAWQEATAKGKTEEAVQAKRDQVLNNAAARAAMDALAEGKKMVDFFARVAKGSNEKTVEKGRDPDIVNAARAILAAYGVDTPATRGAAEYLAKVEQHDPQLYAALQPSVQGALAMAQPLTALTYEQLQSLHEEIQSLWHLAKRSRMMEVDGNLLDIDDAATELNARLEAIGVPASLPGEAGALTPGEIRTRWLQHAGSLLRRAEQWAEGMDGKYGGPFLRLVFQPVKVAAEAYRTERLTYRKAYQALVNTVAPSLQKGLIQAPELGPKGYTFGRGHNGIGHAELLHAILHTGNESNKRKLLLGRQWATENADGTLVTTKWDAFIKRMQDTGVLAKVHYDFAQGVWDLLEKTKPLAQKAHRDVFGRYFDEVTAEAFDTPFGSYRGGYVPAQADTRIVPDADLRALQNAENEAMAYSFPTTNKGFTKARTEYNRPLILDLRTIGQHIDKVLLFSHMEPAVRDVQRLLSRPAVSSPLNKIDPTIYAGMLTPWLNRSAKQIVETPIMGDGRISRVLSVMRARAGMSLMFANVSNALQQVTGFSTALAKVKADGLQSSMLRAAAQMVAQGPKKMAQDVAALSPFMATRMSDEIAAINQTMNEILLDPSLLERAQAWTSKHAYFLQSALDNTMGPIIWTSAYNGALAKGMAAADAVHYADGVIRQTQGSTLPEDVSRIETGPAYARLFTQFIGYFNMMANTNATALKQIQQDVGLRKGAGRAFSVVLLGLLVPLWVAEAIAQAMKGGPDDPDGDGYLDDWIAAVFGMGTIKGVLASVPFIGQLITAGMNRFNTNPADDRVSASPAVSMLEAAAGVPVDFYKLAKGDQVNAKTVVRDVASLVSVATGLPATAVARPLGYLAGEDQGTITPTSTADAARGLVTGVASPQSKNK